MKKVLIIGANSQIAESMIELLKDWEILTTSRNSDTTFKMDVLDEETIRVVAKNVGELDAIVNFAGVAISSPVEFLNAEQLQKQFDIVLFGLLKIIQNFYPKLKKGGRIINVSSMASFGIFPFISPYCASKSAADILLSAFGRESNTKVISIKPGVVKTKFWKNSIELNKINFNNFNEKYNAEREFLIENAKKNMQKGLEPKSVAKVIIKALNSKNPKPSYCIGLDAKIARLSQILPSCFVDFVIRKILKIRVNSGCKGLDLSLS